MKWLDDKKVDVPEWPGNSPDLNPVEELRDNMKLNFGKGIFNTPQMIRVLREIWVYDIDVHYSERLSDSMSK